MGTDRAATDRARPKRERDDILEQLDGVLELAKGLEWSVDEPPSQEQRAASGSDR